MTTTSLDENTAALLARAHTGSRGALCDLMSRVEVRLLSMARRGLGQSVRGQTESRDILQDVLAETVKRLPVCDFRDNGAFWAWLKRLTSNKIRDLARRVSVENALRPGRLRPSVAAACRDEDSPSRRLIRRESVDLLESALRSLPRRQELVIRLRDIEGMPFEQVASQLGLRTSAAARVLHQRGWVSLTRRLERLGSDGREEE